ncbi:unnamed protein product [Rotaria sp. Silwood2]|nr:unnamed protein product [Rotaria sp. Silwood2]CAF4053925.1 unnamed protein product [Rotaria sp. Silwood2]
MTASATINDTSTIIYRPVRKHEQQQAIDLWYSIFGTFPGMDDRYFGSLASPRYQEGDTLGAWFDGKLVSIVNIARLILRSRDDDSEYQCATITCVGTLEEYRKRGYSRHLLRMAIDKMEQSGKFDVSVLNTRGPKHYSILGWKQVSAADRVSVEWKNFNLENSNDEWRTASDVFLSDGQLLLEIYSNKPRIYQFDRSPTTTFEHWVGWSWQREGAIVCMLRGEEQGYAVISNPTNENNVCISEWRAPNVDIERKLFKLAADEIHRRHKETKVIWFRGLPQYMSLDDLEQCGGGVVNTERDRTTMFRNIRLPDDKFEKIKPAYSSGEAIFWSGDYF